MIWVKSEYFEARYIQFKYFNILNLQGVTYLDTLRAYFKLFMLNKPSLNITINSLTILVCIYFRRLCTHQETFTLQQEE